MSRDKEKPSLASLSRETLRDEDFDKFTSELFSGTDRCCALVGGAQVDASLVQAIVSQLPSMSDKAFERLFWEKDAILYTFASRIEMGLVLGVYEQRLKSRLDTIRRVRNVFAHAIRPLTFEHELISGECNKLDRAELRIGSQELGLSLPRQRYLGACILSTMELSDIARNRIGPVGLRTIREIFSDPQAP